MGLATVSVRISLSSRKTDHREHPIKQKTTLTRITSVAIFAVAIFLPLDKLAK
jgi:hypothetical protein